MDSIMSWISEIKEFKPKTTATWIGIFMGTVSPGFLILYQYRPELIEKLDIIKLIIFAISLTLPVFVVNLANMIDYKKIDPFPDDLKHDLKPLVILASGMTVTELYTALFFAHGYHLKFQTFCAFVLIIVCIMHLSLKWPDKDQRKKEAEAKTSP